MGNVAGFAAAAKTGVGEEDGRPGRGEWRGGVVLESLRGRAVIDGV